MGIGGFRALRSAGTFCAGLGAEGKRKEPPSGGSSLLRLPLPPCSYPGGRNAPRSSPRLQRFENKRGPEWQPVRVDVRYPASGIECAICRARPCGCIHMARYSFSFSEHSQQEVGARSAPSLSGRNRGGNGSSKRVETPGGGVHPFCPPCAGQAPPCNKPVTFPSPVSQMLHFPACYCRRGGETI